MSPRPPMRTPPDPARLVALDLLRAVDVDDAYANLALPRLLSERGLSGRDAAFATDLAYGALRMRGHLDHVISQCVDRPLAQVDADVLRLLRLGTQQILHMRVPHHAAVSSTVDLARAITGAGRVSFINAVLRKITQKSADAWLQDIVDSDQDGSAEPAALMSRRHSHPRWMVTALHDALQSDHGGGWEETQSLLQVHNTPPTVTLVARPGQSTVDELLGSGAQPGRWSPFAAMAPAGRPGSVPAVAQGRAGVQDEGSQLVALALATAPISGRDTEWLDACAGPGGKAALLAGLVAARGGCLTAVEISEHRAALVRQVLPGTPHGNQQESPHRVVVGDARFLDELSVVPQGGFDRILIDAPCTGLGALRRRPEARWRRTPADLAALSVLQRDLLLSALRSVRVGGVVGYATCSPHLAETTFVVDDTVKRASTMGITIERLDAVRTTLDIEGLMGREDLAQNLGSGPDLRLWPHRHDTDGMFLALLRRA
jgi:16S rRNA (cytosine967-C5)-methyltransferase